MARKPKQQAQPQKRIYWDQITGRANLFPQWAKEQSAKGNFPLIDDAFLEESSGHLVVHLTSTQTWALYSPEGAYLGGSEAMELETPACAPAGFLRANLAEFAPAVDGNGTAGGQQTIANDGEWTTHDDVEVTEAMSSDESREEAIRLANLIEEMTGLWEERRRSSKSFNEQIKEADEQSKAAAIAVKSGKRKRYVPADIIHDPAHGVKRLYFAGTQTLIREIPMTAEEIERATPLPPAQAEAPAAEAAN